MDSEKTSHSVNIICSDTVRYSFVSHLSGALRRQDISVSVFADTDGRELETCSAPDDQNEGARVSVVVFSETYASSIPWFVKLLERHKNNGYVIVPVFYGVDPSVVNRNHECLRTLPRAGSSTGHHSSDSELVEEIVRDVYGKLFPTERIGTYSRLLEIENLLCEQPWDIRSLGIWGMPGIGKTTLAKSVFDQVSTDYDASCFIENFDEALYKAGPHRLLEEKVLKTVIEKFGVSSCYITRLSLLRDKLCDTRILLVLDDVRNPLVAESFLGRLDWFGPGSLIIITSRYKQVFALCQVNQIYKVRGLDEQEALYLFSQSAFEKDMPEKNDMELTMKVIDYANGNPLALRIYGRELKGRKSEMEAAFLDVKQCPPPKIQDGIRSVYGALGDNEKHIFLDIACFFKGENVDYAVQLLKGCGYFPRVGIDVLVDKCLVTISENTLQMNDLIQDIFREIFIEERIQMKKCTTLWQPSIIRYLLEDDELKGDDEPKETPKCVMVAEDIKGISLDTSVLVFVVNPDAFKNMVSLRFLKIYSSHSANVPGLEFPKGLNSLPRELRLLHWENYPFETLPQGFDLRELVELNMPYSQLKKLRARTKNLERLKRIRLCHSRQLVKFSIHGHAQNVELIDLQGCVRLDSFPAMTKLQHLRVLNLSGCSNIRTIPGLPPNIEELSLQGTSIEELPKSIVAGCSQPNGKELMNHIKYFPGFEHIDLESVTNLVKVSTYNQGFGKLVRLNMKDCFHLRSLLDMSNLESLQTLDLSGCFSLEEIKGFPRNMKELYLAGTRIRELPEFPPSLEFLNAHDCYVLKSVRLEFEQLPRHYTFSNCFSLTSETTVEFLEKGLTKVIRLDREQNQEHIKAPAFNICFPADTCPCTSVHWRAGSFVMVELSPSTRQALLGFAMLVRVSFQDDCHNTEGLGIRCICTWGTKSGHFGRIERIFKCWAPTEAPRVEKDHIFVFYDSEMHPCAGEKKYSSTSDDEIKFEFHTVSGENKLLGANCMVIECGVQVITAPTGDKLVSESIGESECRGIIEEDTPPLARKPEAKSTSVIEEDTTLFPREPEAQSISVIEEVTPFPREPEAKSLSVIEEVTPPFLREPEATSRSLSSSEPHKRYSMYSKPRSKRIAFWKWLDCFPRVTSMPHKNLKTRRSHSRDIDEAIEASRWSKEEGKINQVDAKEQIKPSNDDVEEDVKSPPSTCNGCNSAIENGISVNALGAVWHPECFCCLHCHRPIAMHEIPGLKRMYHKPCYKEFRLPNCYVCKEKIPSTEEGRKYYAHPFWGEKYCPSHEVDGTHKCISCERLEPRGTNYVLLADGRWLCPECMESAVMDTYECHSLHIEIREFFEGLNLKVEKEFPVLLVETQALNKAVDEEKSDYHHAAVTRGVCLSEEQIVSIVLRITLMGPSKQQINIVRETQKVCGCEVTAILIMYGLPRLLTGYILVHEMMHAWLRLNDVRNLTNHGETIFGLIAGCTNINVVLEEGLCQVLAFMWLESQKGATLDASSSSNFSAATTSKKGDQSDFEKKFLEFCKEQIKNDDGPVYGPGFKKVMKMMDSNNNNLMKTLKDIVRAAKF